MMPDGTLQIHKNASTSAWDAEESAEEMLKPLIVAIEAQGHIAEIVADEVPRHCATLLSYPETAPSAAAYVLLRNLDEIDYLTSAATPSLFANPTVQEVIDATADVVKSRLSEWSKENVRAGLTAWFHSVIGFERLTSLIPASAIYMSAPRVIHQGLDDLVVATPGHAILAALTGKGVNRAKRSDARKALAILGEKFSSYEPPYFGGRVFDMDDLRSEIVQPYFRTGISVVESPELETSIREKAAHLPRNVAFGGAVLLGAIIENEEWSLVDESEDQIAFLSLGLLQSLEMLFVARTEPGMYFAMRSVVDRAGFTEEQRRVLLGWAEREVDFTIFS